MPLKACLASNQIQNREYMLKAKILVFILASQFASYVLAEIRLNVVGLFSNKAIVTINGGVPRSLSAGQTIDGVKLITANSETATFLVEGKRQTLKMGQAVSVAGHGEPVSNNPVSLYANQAGHFLGNLSVNGVSLKYLVDTGATTVAFNSGDAKYAKIDYEKGERVKVSTANGLVNAYMVKLNTLKIGTITLNNVEATVVEGGFPQVVLLGMSALNRLEMKRDNSIMTLTKKY
jgi:aspartyl protease family protein